jgi:uncharacterized protein YbbC (DUF1343 family)
MFKKLTLPGIGLLLLGVCLETASCSSHAQEQNILTGACQIEKYLPRLYNKRTGLLVNHTSLVGQAHLIDTLISSGIDVCKIFTPEHGFLGKADAGAVVHDNTYGVNNISVISLYGKKRKPEKSDLQDIDVMVFDIQDVGVRFYTYISTLHYVMEACAENAIPLIVLDRPNPNGHYVDGPVLEMEYSSFVGMHPVPVVYGMTIGEYARMINGEGWLTDSLQCELTVIKCQNYTHHSFYRLPVSPSPNLSTMEAIYLYPSTGLFEGTVVSEGRGTIAPFRIIGHPAFPDSGFSFIPVPVQGASLHPKLEGKVCYGIDLRGIDLDTLQAWASIKLEFLLDFYHKMDMGAGFFTDYFDLLAGNGTLRSQIIAGKNPEQIEESWSSDLAAFKKIRAKYLLYPDFQ